jgi:hypothetical protein
VDQVTQVLWSMEIGAAGLAGTDEQDVSRD